MDEQHRHGGRGDAGQAGGLTEGDGASGREALARFGRQADDGSVVEVVRHHQGLVGLLAGDLVLLAFDVTGVLGAHFDLQAHGLGEAVVEGGEFGQRVFEARLGSTQQVEGADPLHALRLQPRDLGLGGIALVAEERPAFVIHQTEFAPALGEAQVGVVLPEQQAVLGTAGEHPVGLGDPAGHEVIDQHAEVALAAGRHPGGLVPHLAGGVETGDQTLGARLLVAGRAVDLAGEVEPADGAGLEGRSQVAGVEVVVLDGVAGAGQVRLLEAADAAHELDLYVIGQAGRDAVRVDLVGVEALGLDEDLVGGPVGEALDFVLDRRAVAGPHAFDLAGVHRRAIAALTDQVVSALISTCYETIHLSRVFFGSPEERKDRQGRVRALGRHHTIIKSSSIKPRWGAGLQATHPQG